MVMVLSTLLPPASVAAKVVSPPSPTLAAAAAAAAILPPPVLTNVNELPHPALVLVVLVGGALSLLAKALLLTPAPAVPGNDALGLNARGRTPAVVHAATPRRGSGVG